MEIEELSIYLKDSDLDKKVHEQSYWANIWDMHVRESTSAYSCLSTKEALTRLISEENFKNRARAMSCEELGVWIRVGDICYIDFGINYINEAGFQHFGIILCIKNNKVLVVPMTSNKRAYRDASENNSKWHLMAIGKIDGMHQESTLFLNDSKFISSARIIDVKAHIPPKSKLFCEIKQRFHDLIG